MNATLINGPHTKGIWVYGYQVGLKLLTFCSSKHHFAPPPLTGTITYYPLFPRCKREPGVDVIKLFWRESGKSRFPLKPKKQE